MRFLQKKANVFLLLAIIGGFVCISNYPVLLFLYVTMIFGLIFFKARYSFFSALAFIMLFSYMQVIIYKLTGECSGMLKVVGKDIPFYFSEMSIVFVSFFLVELFFVWFTKLIENEKNIYVKGPELDFITSLILLIIALILVILVFPSFPQFVLDVETRRTQGISGMYGFLLLSLCMASLTIDMSFQYKFFHLGYVFIIFWVLGHAERVEILGFLIYYMIKIINYIEDRGRNIKKIRIKKIIIFGGMVTLVVFCIWIGLYRLGANNITGLSVLKKTVLQGTCGDVLYIFNCAIDMWKNHKLTYGYTYIDYLLQLIPGATLKYTSAVVIREYYYTVGGSFFFAEPMMNFGMIWTLLSNIEFFAVMSLMLKRVNKLRAYMWIPVVIEIFRTTWYGRGGYILAVCVEMPLLYLGIRVISSRKKNCKNEG